VFGTYLHGPVLARNTELADLLLGWALSTADGPARLDPLGDEEERALRHERLAAGGAPTPNRFFRRLTGHRA
jgi:CobQ-like glutamine amidotransferase family enzyme